MNVFLLWWHFMTQLATRLYSRLLWHPVNLYHTVLSCVQCHYLLFKSSSVGCQRCKCIVFVDSIKTSLLVLNTTSRKTGRCYQITMCATPFGCHWSRGRIAQLVIVIVVLAIVFMPLPLILLMCHKESDVICVCLN